MSAQRVGAPIVITGDGLRSTAIEDATVQAAMQPWIGMECYQLSPGRQLAQLDSLDLGNQQIVRERQAAAVQKLGATPPNCCTISYCTPDPTFRFSELRASDGDTIYFMAGNTEFDLYVPAGAQTAYISFDEEEFLSGARALNPARWARIPQQLFSIHATQPYGLKAVVNQWLEAAETITASGAQLDAGALRNLLMQNILQIASAVGWDDSQPSTKKNVRALHVCRIARAFVEDRLAADVVPTIAEICMSLDVSERTLQYAFRAYVDMSPLAYLRLRRLNRVQAILRASDPLVTTVTSVAMRFGFLHLGRFALDYRRMFDEAPSATLAS